MMPTEGRFAPRRPRGMGPLVCGFLLSCGFLLAAHSSMAAPAASAAIGQDAAPGASASGDAAGAGLPDRRLPPKPDPMVPQRLPAPVRFVTPTGLRVLLLERRTVPVVDVRLVLRVGAAHDPADAWGLAAYTADLLDEGAGDRDASAFAEAVELLGATLGSSVDFETTEVALHVPKARFAQGLALLADAVLRPRFDEAEWQRAKARRRAAFLQATDSPWQLARLAAARAAFGAHRYGAPVEGYPAGLDQVDTDDLRAFHRRHFRPDRAFLVVAGDIDREALEALLAAALGGWEATPATLGPTQSGAPPVPTRHEASIVSTVPPAAAGPGGGRPVFFVAKPEAPQSILFAQARAPDDFAPLDAPRDVANTLLGGSFASRLNQNLRERNQYTYGARARFDLRAGGNRFQAYTAVAAPVTGAALTEMARELTAIRTFVEHGEARRARGYLAHSFPDRLATLADATRFWAFAETWGLEDPQVQQYPQQVLEASEAELLRAARHHIARADLAWIVVGDPALVLPQLAAVGGLDIQRIRPEELLQALPSAG